MKVILHICCGVCAAGAADVLLAEGHSITGYFYNPNIYPEEEYRLRLEAARRTAEKLKFELAAGPYDAENWNMATASLGGEPEGGARCSICYRIRLEKTYGFMREIGADAFTSTLTISPHKSSAEINRIGMETGGASFMSVTEAGRFQRRRRGAGWDPIAGITAGVSQSGDAMTAWRGRWYWLPWC
jgi:predicted adenine nucleotide alpha hydrolase (AANH) superfamily ATPase